MKKTLSAEEMPLYKVFSNEYLFTIPTVQRPYSWTVDEAGDLLDDLIDFVKQYDITEENLGEIREPYFLGSIVLVKKERNLAEVLDGQQRLTTLTILLAVLRDYLGGDYANSISKRIAQEGDKILQTKRQYRLQLRKRDQEFFEQYIQEDGATINIKEDTVVKTDSQKYIRNNALYFINRLNNLDPSIVTILPSAITALCYIVVVSTPNFDSAFRIFTVLNDRGLDLMSSDIIKARAIGDVPEYEQADYTLKWEEVEVALGRNRFNKLFEHIRMIIQKRKSVSSLKDEYDEILKTMNGKEFIDNYLIPYSEIYLKLVDYHTHYYKNPNMLKILSLMERIDNSDWITVAMYYIYHINERLESFLDRLETFAATSMILRRNFNWRMSKYSAILREMNEGLDVFSEESTLELSNSERKEILSHLNDDVYIKLKDTAKRYVLLRLDSILTEGQPYYNHSVITVEHVLPQNPNPGSLWLKNFERPEDYVHKLGNLVLLTRSKNSQAKNYDFIKKKNSYFQSSGGVTSFVLTSQVIQMKEWNPEVVEERQKQLIGILTKAWDLDKVTNNDDAESIYYIDTEKGISASGYPTEQGFLVMKGSKFSLVVNESLNTSNEELRKALIHENTLKREGDFYVLTRDYLFSSPSTASSIILGRSSSGPSEWRLKNGKTLKEVKEY